ncbi:type II toxin-antitoxin system HicB family antitoxin [Sphingobium sp. AN558]|uniref:type II toxin-antitoxin system HicB family antitoxin n=1 Tax=Sphingobium sp. AN558 TaxID=3133442 RepID=UPI0030C539B5
MSAHDYEIDVRPLADDLGGGFVATVPELPGCMSDGETPEEALNGAYDAVECWIAEAARLGRNVPAPARALRYA